MTTIKVSEQDFNNWMQDYIDNPGKFDRDWQSVSEFLANKALGNPVTYGDRCIAYLKKRKSE